jgi:hypothetical protein
VSLGIPPPPEIPRDQWAAWYWDQIQSVAADADDCGIPPSESLMVEDLISGAIDAGVVGHRIPVAGFSELQQLSTLLAPYRQDPCGQPCADLLVESRKEDGEKVTVSPEPPGYLTLGARLWRCRHGARWYTTPAGVTR